MEYPRAGVLILAPFVAGYYLSYLFRTINALIADRLAAELALTAGISAKSWKRDRGCRTRGIGKNRLGPSFGKTGTLTKRPNG
jgi:hypothetical protein